MVDKELQAIQALLTEDSIEYPGYVATEGILLFRGSMYLRGLLQPFNILNQVFEDIALDFITGLPKSNDKEAILVVVDRLTKYGHFFALPRHFNANYVANVMVQGVIKLHGILWSMVSEPEKIFVSSMWKEMARLQGTEMCMGTSYHPQTDGQTEALI
ncbi:hypothetical protein HRI_004512400 [Hibiscus trionum]|uniref:Integrase catalytic domain-containing protein n=1 Tax=Hibiscus trionum TaxID=183268 RepID=A0A9W7J871_HIBTR|nr:hypothetical protein HRI_004512400 [Hibiscus trionum]